MMDYFQASGLDVYKALDLLHQFLGIPPFRPAMHTFYGSARKGEGVRGLIDDIKALLPLDKLEAMYNDKLTSSVDFAAFIAKMRSDEIKATVHLLMQNPNMKTFLEKAKEHKVDIQLVFDILNRLFGWDLP